MARVNLVQPEDQAGRSPDEAQALEEIALLNNAARKRKHPSGATATTATPGRRQTLIEFITGLVAPTPHLSKPQSSEKNELRSASANKQAPEDKLHGMSANNRREATVEDHTAAGVVDAALPGQDDSNAPPPKRARLRGAMRAASPEAPVPLSRGKSSVPRNDDIYEMEDDSEEELESARVPDISERNTNAKGSVAVKAPLNLPRTTRAASRRDAQNTTSLAPAISKQRSSAKAGTSKAKSATTTQASNGKQSEKRVAGSRNTRKASTATKSSKTTRTEQTGGNEGNRQDAQNDQRQGEPVIEDDEENASLDEESSGTKSPRPSHNQTARNSTSKRSSTTTRPTEQQGNETAEADVNRYDEVDSEDDGVNEERPLGKVPEGSDFAVDEEEQEATFFKMKVIDSMLKTSELVGRSWNGDQKSYTDIEDPAQPTSELGTALSREISALTTLFEDLDEQQPNEIIQSANDAGPIVSNINRLLSQAKRTQLTKTKRDRESLALLADLFFFVLPGLVDGIWQAANVYGLGLDITMEQLRLFSKLTTLLQYISEDALNHNQKPVASGITLSPRKYLFARPTRFNLPRVRNLRAALQEELYRRGEIQQRERNMREKEAREIRRQETMAAEARQARKEMEETRQAQLQDLIKQLNRPFTGALLIAELELAIEKERLSQQTQSDKRRPPTARKVGNSNSREISRRETSEPRQFTRYVLDSDEGSEEEEDGDEDDDQPDIERVSVFGTQNNSRSQLPQPWTDDEMQHFIDIIQEHYGNPNVYTLAAEELGKTHEQVFEYAKDLQESMFLAHERGDLTEFEWTYNVWQENDLEQGFTI